MINWTKRDNETLQIIQRYIRKSHESNEKPIRITVSFIGKKFGILDWIKSNPEKMPITVAFLKKHIESIEDFQIRRIYWSSKKIYSEGRILKERELKRTAGLTVFSTKVRKVIQEILENYNMPEVLLKIG